MSTYFDKKKLLESNSDLYISEYDKNLPVSDLGGIIEAKKSYKKASEAGDISAMKAANDRANTIRKTAGSYSGGADGSQYITYKKPYEVRINTKYKSPYEADKKRILNLISEKESFSYDPMDDPIFEIYKKLYTRLGDDAYDRALADGVLRTGGAMNTSAQSAAMQAKNHYNTMLMSKIPELYESSYEKYRSEYERLYDELDLLNELDDSAYKRHRDTVSDWENDREYFYQKDEDMSDWLREQYEFDTGTEYKLTKDENDRAYKESRDRIEDARWEDEYEFDKNSDVIEHATDIAKILYGKSGATTERIKNIIAMLKQQR